MSNWFDRFREMDAVPQNDYNCQLQLSPCWVTGHNSASNMGIANNITKIVELCIERLQKGYVPIKCDGDIYMKILRVRFDFLF